MGVANYTLSTCTSCSSQESSTWEIFGKLAVLVGVRIGAERQHEVVVGPELVPISVQSIGGARGLVLLGGLAGVSLKVTSFMRVMPELTVLTPVQSLPTVDPPLYNRFGEPQAIFLQLGANLSFGNDGFHP